MEIDMLCAILEDRKKEGGTEMILYDNDAYREEFMGIVYGILSSDITNDRANQIIDAFDSAPQVEIDERSSTDPLTLEELREMDGEPVYLDFGDGGEWVLVRTQQGKVFITHKNTICVPINILFKCAGKAYCRKPEGRTR